MNLSRYKVKLPGNDTGARPLEFVGSWIMFGGGVLFTLFLATGGYRGNENLHFIVYVIGALYAISWFSARNKWLFLAFTLLSFTAPLVVIQIAITSISSGNDNLAVFMVPYSIYIFSVFLALFLNLIKQSRSAV